MKSIEAAESKNIIKQSALAFASSFVLLITIFISTMLIHQNGQIDMPYLAYAIPRIAVISIAPIGVIVLGKISKWYISVPCGALVGFLAAVVFASVK
jgi:hypothetical protein